MRECRNAQRSIFDFYARHEHGQRLRRLSELLDEHEDILELIEQDFDKANVARTGARGLSIESIFRCLLLKQILGVSYEKLSFLLSDSPSYRSFACLRHRQSPSRSALQAGIRRIRPQTLQQIHHRLLSRWIEWGTLSIDTMRVDSTVVDSNIAPPSDSQLLDDGVRVLSRLMSRSRQRTGVKLRFCDQRKRSKSLAFRIFHAKKAEKDRLYPKLLTCVATTLRQTSKAIGTVGTQVCGTNSDQAKCWIQEVEHYRSLLLKVIDQTQRRVFNDESVPASEKIVSLFEPHTDIIVKALREVQYGHKINLATQAEGFVTYLNIERGNPCDKTLYLPVLEQCRKDYDQLPDSLVADGGYACQANVHCARAQGVRRAVFHKPVGLGYHAMGVKKKTFERLRGFRAGIEGNISELKRVFGLSRATWKGHEGFKAYVWSAVLSYNLVRMVRIDPG